MFVANGVPGPGQQWFDEFEKRGLISAARGHTTPTGSKRPQRGVRRAVGVALHPDGQQRAVGPGVGVECGQPVDLGPRISVSPQTGSIRKRYRVIGCTCQLDVQAHIIDVVSVLPWDNQQRAPLKVTESTDGSEPQSV